MGHFPNILTFTKTTKFFTYLNKSENRLVPTQKCIKRNVNLWRTRDDYSISKWFLHLEELWEPELFHASEISKRNWWRVGQHASRTFQMSSERCDPVLCFQNRSCKSWQLAIVMFKLKSFILNSISVSVNL